MLAKSTISLVERVLVAICLLFTAACDTEQNVCDRAGCDAVGQLAVGYDITTGIAGAAASQSDAVANDCMACPLASATLNVYESTTAITSQSEAQALIDQQGPVQVVSFVDTYEHALTPGEYLVCEGSEDEAVCAGLTIGDGEVATVHVKFMNAPTTLIVYEPGATEPTADRIFAVNMP